MHMLVSRRCTVDLCSPVSADSAPIVSTGDKVIIMCYAQQSAEEAKTHKPQVVFVGEDNRIERITTYEKHGLLRDMA